MSEKNMRRKPRADGERNRKRLLEVARVAFAEHGLSASLEDIARTAGVGIGTLYRHFPSRQVLVDEIYREQGERLTAAAAELSRSHTPVDALREWLMLFIQSLENKQIMAGVLACMSEDGGADYCALSGELLVTVLDGLLQNAIRSGSIGQKIESLDLLCAIAGIASYSPDPTWEQSAKRLVNVLLAGLKCSEGQL
ncbi:TetR/AcrR family transcriptional regulator [Burkholderia sp. BCC1998]|uniref:TetR/AcrR family transcriptional regulator n=1 Tax=Burkholderia sp. BCC1998 TaxID=2817447 RepID=UPI002AB71039|nr:TetR family transcriptional regulator [Burkholderia sp. BCC1998]